MTRMTRILALDLSLTTAGVCRLHDYVAGQPVFCTQTVRVPKPRVPGAKPGKTKEGPTLKGTDRLLWWRQWLTEGMRLDHYDIIAMEAPAMRGAGMVVDIGKLFGVIELLCHDHKKKLIQVPPTSIKLYATGKGNSDQQRINDMAAEMFGEQITDEHQADAAWLCRMVAQADSLHWPYEAKDYELRAIKALREVA